MDLNVEFFRQSLLQGWGAGPIGSDRGKSGWAEEIEVSDLQPGDVLIADPRGFIGEVSARGAKRVGMRGPMSRGYSTREKLRILPVILVLSRDDRGVEGVLLTQRTGQLLGDFIGNFQSRPLMFGGPSLGGVTMVHPYKEVPGSVALADSGLYAGGDFGAAQEWVEEGQGSSLRFRFFINRVYWNKQDILEETAAAGNLRFHIPIRCSMDLILNEDEDLNDKPLWAKLAELAGGEVLEIAREFSLL